MLLIMWSAFRSLVNLCANRWVNSIRFVIRFCKGINVVYLSIYISLNLKLELFLCKSCDDVACLFELQLFILIDWNLATFLSYLTITLIYENKKQYCSEKEKNITITQTFVTDPCQPNKFSMSVHSYSIPLYLHFF